MTGEGIEDYGQGGQVARDTYATLVRMSTLPLATISSLTEVLLNIQKAGTKESFKGLGNALAQGTELITNNIRRKLGQQGLSDPEIFNEPVIWVFVLTLNPLLGEIDAVAEPLAI